MLNFRRQMTRGEATKGEMVRILLPTETAWGLCTAKIPKYLCQINLK